MKKLELIAKTKGGWALVKEGDRHFVVGPPYQLSHRKPQSEQQVIGQLAQGDFLVDRRPMEGWNELVRYLKQRRVEEAGPERVAAARGAGLRLIAFATETEAWGHLEAIRKHMLGGHTSGVQAVLEVLLGAKSVQSAADANGRNPLIGEIQSLLVMHRGMREKIDVPAASNYRQWLVQNRKKVEAIQAQLMPGGMMAALYRGVK